MSGPRILAILAIAGACWPAALMVAQRIGSTNLVVNVEPEAHLSPSQISLRFTVSANGTAIVPVQPANISAWVRALPNQQIRVTARLGTVSGPSGPLPSSAVAWTGSASQSTAGGQTATCTQGSFAGGTSQELVAGWQRSGTLTCAVNFSLEKSTALAPGVYTATIDLLLHAE